MRAAFGILKMKRIVTALLASLVIARFAEAGGATAAGAAKPSATPKPASITPAEPLLLTGPSLEWRAGLAGLNRESSDYSGKLVGFRFDAHFRYLLSEELRFDVTPSLRFMSGSVQTPDPKDGADNRLLLYEAGAAWEPSRIFAVQAGALNQSTLHTSLLMDDRPFPAARTAISFGDERAALAKLSLESAVPTSTSLSTNTCELEPTPGLQTLAFDLSGKPSPRLEWNAGVGAFAFQNLPSAVAQESSLFGNTVDRASETQSAFRYQYRGVEARAKLWLPVKRWSVRMSAEGLQNQDAPSGYGSAWTAQGGLGYRMTSRDDIYAGGRVFRIEPDAAVASFANPGYGYTNRAGYAAELTLSFDRNRYQLNAMGGETELIYENYPQSHERFLRLTLETSYAGF